MHVFYRNWLLAVVWPYLLWGVVVVVAEQLLRGVRNPVDTSPIDITLLWTPIAWLWFLYVFAIFQLLAVACRRAPNVLVGLGAAGVLADALWPLPVLLHLCCYFLIFYAVGVAYGPRLLTWRISPTLGLSALIASVPLALVAIPNIAHLWTWPGLPVALAGVVGICWLGQRFEDSPWLLYLGRRSMAIYVIHIFFISATRVVLVKGLGVTSVPIVFTACLAAGFAGALATYEIAARLGITVIFGLGLPAYARPRSIAVPAPWGTSSVTSDATVEP